MSHLSPGLLGCYNSLADKHLIGYFSNTRIRRHLQKVGLISRSGRIIPEKEYRHTLLQRVRQRHVRESLAQAVFRKVLELERLHQIEIKRKLEEFERRERVNKIKVERSNRYEEEPVMILPPRPPTGPKTSSTRQSGPDAENWESTESARSSRPNTAPGTMQRAVRLKPLQSNSTSASLKRNSSRFRHQDTANDTDHPVSSAFDRDATRHLTLTNFSCVVSPYRLPVINNFLTPVPPLTKRKDKGPKGNGTLRGRRLRPTTAPDAATAVTEEAAVQQASARSVVSVRMVYLGKSVHLTPDLTDMKDEVKVFQQHCGGENLCVYRGRLTEGETFQFVSRRHRGFPFSLTFFLNGLQVERLSSCCEFKHRKGSRLGGRHGHFGFFGVEGASPCYRCIIAMGLDKKPTPPKTIKEDPLISKPQGKGEEDEDEEEKDPELQEPDAAAQRDATQGGKALKDYEEDFEADDEGPMEDEMLPSPNREEEEESRSKDENENGVRGKHQDQDKEPEAVKRSPSISSSSSSESEEDEREGVAEPDDDEERVTADVPGESVRSESHNSTLTSEKDASVGPGRQGTETNSVSLPQSEEEDTEVQGGPVYASEESGVDMIKDTDGGGGAELGEGPAGDPAHDEATGAELEGAKSVQAKLAEAVLEAAVCRSEPELSDTTTEEDEVASIRPGWGSRGAEVEKDAVQWAVMEREEICEERAASETKTRTQGHVGTWQTAEELDKETQETAQLQSDTAEEPTEELEKTGEVEGSKAEELLVTEAQEELESGNRAEETAGTRVEEPDTVEAETEQREVITEPQAEEPGEEPGKEPRKELAEEPGEMTAGDTPNMGDTEELIEEPREEPGEEPGEKPREKPGKEPREEPAEEPGEMTAGDPPNMNQHGEIEGQEQAEGAVENTEDAGAAEGVGKEFPEEKEIRADGEEAGDDLEGVENPRVEEGNTEESRGCSEGDGEMKAEEKEKGSEVTGPLQDGATDERSEARERVTEERQVEVNGEKTDDDEQRENESAAEKDDASKPHDTEDAACNKSEEEVKGEESIKEAETEDGGKGEREKELGVRDEDGESDVARVAEGSEEERSGRGEVEVRAGGECESTVEASADQDPQTEWEVEGGAAGAEVDERHENEERNSGEMTSDLTNQERESKVGVGEIEKKPEEEGAGKRGPERGAEENIKQQEEANDSKGVQNDEPEGVAKQSELPRETEDGGEREEKGGVDGGVDGKEDGEEEEDPRGPSVSADVENGEQETIGHHTELGEQEEPIEEGRGETNQRKTKQDSVHEGDVEDNQNDGDKGEVQEAQSLKGQGDHADEAELGSESEVDAEDPADAESKLKPVADLDRDDTRDGLPASGEARSPAGESSIPSEPQPEEAQPEEKALSVREEDRVTQLPSAAPPPGQGDLVSNWVNVHRAARYFETFPEPLEDMESLGPPEGEKRVRDEALEAEEAEDPSESTKHQQIEYKAMAETPTGNIKMETKSEALEPEAKSLQPTESPPNPTKHLSETGEGPGVDELVHSTESQHTAGAQQGVTIDTVINLPSPSVMKVEISQAI
ncbi:glutamate-rich protein 3 [Electrophorus electricus]|uniref:glutamate-rich protein 3 n=1 Tax=Electrophorus electricus TaxID=8005 RepID=UPI0015CFB922|nr:glutamate-rich protein 3 [Electrophorus electricus]